MQSDDVKTKVQSQFGRSAGGYAVSDVHAKGESLGVLLARVRPEPEWEVLDVATGAGHTALSFAPFVRRVVALDLTAEMLAQTRQLADARKLSNIETCRGDAEAIPFPDESFDLVCCRLAFHHFPNPQNALREFVRVLRPGGFLGFSDNLVVEDPQGAEIYNQIEKLRDPSHVEVQSLAGLEQSFRDAGLEVQGSTKLTKEFEFHDWADRQHVSAADKEKLLEMFRALPAELEPLLQPRWADGTMYFTLWEAVIVARKHA
jgi:ubiquinone/menaquinone biosynthesis C-methylase UbiE